MKLIAYARVSTGDQQTIEAQGDKARAFCQLHDHELTHIYTDEGVSGQTIDRDGLRDCLNALKKADGIVITKLDRLSRSLMDWCWLMDYIHGQKKVLVSVTDGIDTSTAAGEMMANMLATFAQFELRSIKERTLTSMNYLRKQNRRISRHAPYGYEFDPNDSQHLIPHSQEAWILGKIRGLHSRGCGFAEIANRLNAEGRLNRSGKPWNRSAIYKIVKRQEKING